MSDHSLDTEQRKWSVATYIEAAPHDLQGEHDEQRLTLGEDNFTHISIHIGEPEVCDLAVRTTGQHTDAFHFAHAMSSSSRGKDTGIQPASPATVQMLGLRSSAEDAHSHTDTRINEVHRFAHLYLAKERGGRGNIHEDGDSMQTRSWTRVGTIRTSDNLEENSALVRLVTKLSEGGTIQTNMGNEEWDLRFRLKFGDLTTRLRSLVMPAILDVCNGLSSLHSHDRRHPVAMVVASYARCLLAETTPHHGGHDLQLEHLPSKPSVEFYSFGTHAAKVATPASIYRAEPFTTQQSETASDERHWAHWCQQILHWLSPPNSMNVFCRARQQWQRGTGEWLLNSHTFKSFMGNQLPMLWLYGEAGCGKTVLSSVLIETLQSHLASTDAAVLFFYFDFADKRKQSFDDALRSFACQAARVAKTASRELAFLYEFCGHGQQQPSTWILHQTLKRSFASMGRVTIVLDALEECTTSLHLLQWIRESVTSDSINVQILATSRHEPEIELAFGEWLNHEARMRLERSDMDIDIRAYIQHRILAETGLACWRSTSTVRNEMADRLTAKANGV